MKIRIGPGDEKKPSKPKVKVKAPTKSELEAANAFAKDIAARKGLFNAENMHVGGQVPKFIDDAGRGLDPNATPQPTPNLPTNVPNYVKSLEWDKDKNLPYYIDEKTGYMQYVPKEVFFSSRFNPQKGKVSIVDVIAKR